MIRYRLATLEDADAIADLQTAGWRDAFRGIMPDAVLDGPLDQSHRRLWRRLLKTGGVPMPLLALDAVGSLLGFCSSGSPRASLFPQDVEIYALYVRQDMRRVGLGRKLVGLVADRALRAGYSTLMLWTLEANSRARAFYEHLGGRVAGRELHEFEGQYLPEIAYVWDSLLPLVTASAYTPSVTRTRR